MSGEYTKRFCCIGGDKRTEYMRRALVNVGWKESDPLQKGKLEFTNEDILILPIPSFSPDMTVRGAKDVNIRENDIFLCENIPKTVIGGVLPSGFIFKCEEKGVKVINITDRDDYAILNAVPTAEAAIMIALEQLPVSLWNTRVLVTGYGRVSQVLCDRLTAFGAKVTVAARKASDRAYAETRGAEGVDIRDIEDIVPERYRLIFNTVPFRLIDANFVSRLREDSLTVDLASLPGGCDTEAMKEYGRKWIHALSLPGRNAPETAGKILAQIIVKTVREEENA